MTEYSSQIVASLGRKGSGKSQLLWELFVSQAPRVITIGHIPQDLARDPNVITVRGRDELYRAIERASAFDRWHIAAALGRDALLELFLLIAPGLEAPPERSLSNALNGLALHSGEAYQVFPVGYTPEPMLEAIRQSRHYSLDLYMASQRPHSVQRELTAQADLIFSFAQSEPRDIAFLAESVSTPYAQVVRRLKFEDHSCVVYDRADSTSKILDRNYRPAGRVDAFAAAGQ